MNTYRTDTDHQFTQDQYQTQYQEYQSKLRDCEELYRQYIKEQEKEKEQDTLFIRHPIKIKANICIRIRKWLKIKIMNLLY
jgi:hypothetical protein